MEKKEIRFGQYIKELRNSADRQLTLRDVARILDVSVSYLSDVEHSRRMPFNDDKLKTLCSELDLGDAETATLYDLAAKERSRVPSDITDVMNSEVGKMARMALRMTKDGKADVDDWKDFIRRLEAKDEGREGGDQHGSVQVQQV